MNIIPSGLPDLGPFSWAVCANNIVYTTQIPIRQNGALELGDIREQATLVFANLQETIQRAGGTLQCVVQVIIYLIDMEDGRATTEIWNNFFSPPWPNRATIGVSALAVPGMKIEIVATAVLKTGDPPKNLIRSGK